MKLRVRNAESKQTLRIEVPDSCSFEQLKQFIAEAVISSPSSLRLSLNRHEELHASSPHDSLRSLGITAGDLIFYSLNQFHSNSHSQSSSMDQRIDRDDGETLNPIPPISSGSQVINPNCQTQVLNSSNSFSGEKGNLGGTAFGRKELRRGEVSGATSIDIDDHGDEAIEAVGKNFAVPFYFRRLLMEVLGEELGENGEVHRLMVLAVHAVLKESGFVGFDAASGMRVDGFHLPDECSSMGSTISLWYALPETLDNGGGKSSSNMTDAVVVKFQTLGHFVNVYGSLANDSSGLYSVRLDKNWFFPTINGLPASRNPLREVAGFWKNVKDGLALPLMIDLCAKAGLPSPPCLMRLPSELKSKILELLPGDGIAKLGCTCKEFQDLSRNNELWKKKFEEEFGSEIPSQTVPWKKRFAVYWENKMASRWQRSSRPPYDDPFYSFIPLRPLRRDPIFQPPGIRGGDYDRFPAIGFPSPLRQPGQLPRFHYRRRFSPNCNLGGLSG